MSVENREHPRVETNIEITFKEKGSLIRSYMLNVSNGGLFLKTAKPLPIDSVVNMHVKLPDQEETMIIVGRVVWINAKSGDHTFPSGMGIQFLKMDPEYKKKINEFVDEHRSEIKQHSLI